MSALVLTDEQRSMIASLVIASANCNPCLHCLCCSSDGLAIAADIVGEAHAPTLVDFAHEQLGCGWACSSSSSIANLEATYLERVQELETLGLMPGAENSDRIVDDIKSDNQSQFGQSVDESGPE